MFRRGQNCYGGGKRDRIGKATQRGHIIYLSTTMNRWSLVLLGTLGAGVHSLLRGVPLRGLRKRGRRHCQSLVEGCPRGPQLPGTSGPSQRFAKWASAAREIPLSENHRFWHLEVRLELPEVAGDGGGILMGTDTHVLQRAVLQDSCFALGDASLPLWKGG